VKLGIILFISGRIDEESIRSSYLTSKDADHLIDLAGRTRKERIERIAGYIEESLRKRIPDDWEYRSIIYRLLFRCSALAMPGVLQKDKVPDSLMEDLV
jgi:hypothetical protein